MGSKTQEPYDVLVVGSGASGGWAAKRIAEAGARVALVDAGRPLRITDLDEHGATFDLPYRASPPRSCAGRGRPRAECYACTERNADWFCNDLEEPYTTAEGKPFSWQGRMRVTGGRTVVWGRQSYRMGDLDFKAASLDGFGEDWPLGYADLVPYYDLVEDYVGISGLAEGAYELPDSRFHPAMAFKCAERRLRERVKSRLGWTVTIGRVANITKSLNGRAPCHYCGPCYWGCVTNSYFNSAFTTVADALASGRCTHVPNAMVHKVLTDPVTSRATGLLYVDRVTREPREIRGRVVVLCAQALESARILLNSKPGGLGNSSGALGHYLMDHLWVAGGATGPVPRARGDTEPRRAEPPERHLRHPLPQHEGRPALEEVPPRVRLPGRPGNDLQLRRAGIRRRLQARRPPARLGGAPRRLRRVPALLRELRRDRPLGPGRRLRHPDPRRSTCAGATTSAP